MTKKNTEIEELAKKYHDLIEKHRETTSLMDKYNAEIDELNRRNQELQRQGQQLNDVDKIRLKQLKRLYGAEVKRREETEKFSELIEDEVSSKFNMSKKSLENYSESLDKNQKKTAAAEKGISKLSQTMEILSHLVNIYVKQNEIYLTNMKWGADVWIKDMETRTKKTLNILNTFGQGISNTFNSVFSTITQGISEGAFSSAAASIENSRSLLSTQLNEALLDVQQRNFNVIREQEKDLDILKARFDQAGDVIGVVAGVLGLVGAGPMGAGLGIVGKGLTSAIGTAIASGSQLEIEKTKLLIEQQEKAIEQFNEKMEKTVDILSNVVNNAREFTKAIEDIQKKTDESSKKMYNMLGQIGNVNNFEKYVFEQLKDLSFTSSDGTKTYLDANSEDWAKMQQGYVDSSGRNVMMNRNGLVDTLLLGKVLGGDNDLAAALLGDMHYFNQTIENSRDLIYDMFQQANKAGISNRKFAKDLQSNLKLAQKYTFKGGIESLMKMSIWAQKVRFNMESMQNIVDNIQDGGLENLITQSARLQVLGGRFAMGADPMAMFWESYNDPEALIKRFTDMTKGMGRFDKNTGQMVLNQNDAMLLKEYAKAANIDYTEARQQIEQRIKNEQINRSLKTNKYNDEQLAMLYSKAQYDTNTGTWKVNLTRGAEDINNLTDTDFKELVPVEERIEDYVKNIWTWLSGEEGAKNKMQNSVAGDTWENTRENIQERIKNNLEFADVNANTLKSIVETMSNFVTAEDKRLKEQFATSVVVLTQGLDFFTKQSEQYTNNLKNANSEIRQNITTLMNFDAALKKIIKEWDDKKKPHPTPKVSATKEELEQLKKGNTSTAMYMAADNLRVESRTAAAKGDIRASKVHDNAARGLEMSTWRSMRDGFVESNGQPMFTRANNITPIQDGSVKIAKSDPHDTALFAKSGGPFDTLFNGVFSKVDKIHSVIENKNNINDSTFTPKKISVDKIKVELGGKLELTSDGQSVDIIKELNNNPLLLRSISRMLSEQLSKAFNGGRKENFIS